MSEDRGAPAPSDVIGELYRLFGEGRVAETFPLMDPEVVLHEPGDPEVLPWAGEFRGHEGVQRFYDGLARGLSRIEIDPDSLELAEIFDGRVLVLGTERGVASDTGRGYETRSAWIWTVRDGRITHLQAFHDTAAMAAAFR
jgi:ketosteroid isomerase-like protein